MRLLVLRINEAEKRVVKKHYNFNFNFLGGCNLFEIKTSAGFKRPPTNFVMSKVNLKNYFIITKILS